VDPGVCSIIMLGLVVGVRLMKPVGISHDCKVSQRQYVWRRSAFDDLQACCVRNWVGGVLSVSQRFSTWKYTTGSIQVVSIC
jgi:hypothetical protein